MRKIALALCVLAGIPMLAWAWDNLGYSEFENTQRRVMEVRIYRFKNVQCTNEMIDQFSIPIIESPGDRYIFSCSKHNVKEACYTSDFEGGAHSGLKTGLRCNGEMNTI